MAVVAGTSQLTVGSNQTVTSGLVATQTLAASITKTTQFANGTGAGQVDLIYAKQLTFAASTPQTLDLAAIVDMSGATVNMARIREIVIQVVTTTVDFNLTVGAAAANPWAAIWGTTGTHVVMAGSLLYISDPTSVGASKGLVTSGTSKTLKLDPGSNILIANVIIQGCSAVS